MSSASFYGFVALAAGAVSAGSTAGFWPVVAEQPLQNPTSGDPVSKILLLQIVRAEDERRWDDDLRSLFIGAKRQRAQACGAGGRPNRQRSSRSDLVVLLQKDDEMDVRAMAAFALGEIESPLGADALISALKDRGNSRCVRAQLKRSAK